MTNAWIQRLLTLGMLLGCWAGAYALWPEQRAGAIWLAFAPVLTTPFVIALTCLMAAVVNKRSKVPHAGFRAWLRAWLAETKVSILVVCWWQPFRHRAMADFLPPANGKRGMVLAHGFFCNRALWSEWMAHLQSQGHAFVAVDLEPAYGSISLYADILETAITQVERATGLPPLLVGHSMGGLAIRAWCAQHASQGGSLDRIAHIFTLGTPHQGTAIPKLLPSENGTQMNEASPWLASNAQQLQGNFANKCTCFYSNCDNIVFLSEHATFPGADNQLILDRAHLELVFLDEIKQVCWQALAER